MALYENSYIFLFIIFLTFIRRLQAEEESDLSDKLSAALGAADGTLSAFLMMFDQCVDTHMSQKQFLIDDIQKFVNYPSKTTVGLAPKFTGNRKFFANMITTTAFKDMLAKDTEEIWKNLIKKLRYCDEVVMDQELLKEFYDREVDQSKL